MKTVDKTVSNGNKMTDEERGHFERRIDDLVRRINEGTLYYQSVMDDLQLVIEDRLQILELVDTTYSSGAKKFVAREKFREGKETDGVKIFYLGHNFKKHFHAKTEKDVRGIQSRIHRLRKDSHNNRIITELRGENVAESYLAHLWSDLEKQGHGEDGALLTNSYPNIRYIRDKSGNLWYVFVFWRSSSSGWDIEAYPVTNSKYSAKLSSGSQVFSCDYDSLAA